MPNMTISEAGIEFMKSWEQFQPTVYDDGYGVRTIGYGHKMLRGEDFGTMTEEAATELLRKDLLWAINAVNKALTVDQTAQQFDALVSFEFNTGSFGISTLCRVINSGGDNDAIKAQFMRWVNAQGKFSQGLVNRRTAEVNVYIDGNYVRT